MSKNIKVGDEVLVLNYEELADDAPEKYIGDRGKVSSITRRDTKGYNIQVKFGDGGYFDTWDFKPEQLQLV